MAIYTLNEQFDEAEKQILLRAKARMQKRKKLKKLTWRKFILLVSERR